MEKRNCLFRKTLKLVLPLSCLILFLGTFNQPKAQETNEDKCIKVIQNFGKAIGDLEKTYIECGGGGTLKEWFTPRLVETFGIIGLDGEWARLDSFSYVLQNSPELKAYIVTYGGKINKYGELKERPKPLVYYLTVKRGIDPKRIKIIEGGFREKFEFELWVSPSEKMFPPLAPTVEREKVIFRGRMRPLPFDF